jgi:hypothetical protein
VQRRARKADGDVQVYHPRGQIGVARIADHDVGQPLMAQPQILDPVARLNPARGQLVIHIAFGDRLALAPYAKQHERGDAARDQRYAHPPPPARRRIDLWAGIIHDGGRA